MVNLTSYVSAVLDGQVTSATIRKAPSQSSYSGWWVDLSMTSGIPVPNYYASEPLVAATLNPMRGILHGDNKAPAEKYLQSWELVTPMAQLVGQYVLLDYLLYYPFIDLDTVDEQVLDNTVTLPRYTDGDGVMAMFVCAAPTVGSGSFTYRYVNQDGVERTSPVISYSASSAYIACLLAQQPGSAAGNSAYLNLADGDTGIRQILSITNITGTGGLGTLVLVKPIASHTIWEINTAHEVEFVRDRPTLPRIYDGAYLNMIALVAGAISGGTLTGRLTTMWS